MLVISKCTSNSHILNLIVTIKLMLIKYLLNTILKSNRMVFLFSNYE